ncbi:unnamed protein product [Cyclocybe aegerita]|uniref:Uncharacterized protein n=1 Tax=Cyclocybe aegerita TaxID=1973307 RepID=A0A8S0WZB9_CYCAE|nr:unnamed protein product [Cyclocybe aegerita]
MTPLSGSPVSRCMALGNQRGMFSRSNHHHQRQRASSLSVTLGTRRPRSPETTPPESESDEAQKTSPHTKRTVKRGRTKYTPATEDGPTPAFLPPHTQLLPLEGLPAESPHHAPPPRTQPEPVAAQVKHLESLLDSVLATLVIIRAATNTAVALSDHSKRVFKMLNTLLPLEDPAHATDNLTAPAPTPELASHPKQSYADAAKSCQPEVTSRPTNHARSSPAGATAHHRPSIAEQRPRHPHPHSTSRLIARWDGHPVPQTSSSLSMFVRHLNGMFNLERNPASRGETPRKILAANCHKVG